jgi:GR25 family glycosyltransferase involved in LPS biosynthesis
MKAYAIVMPNHEVSEKGFSTLLESSKSVENKFDIERFDAVTEDFVDIKMKEQGLRWNWPDSGIVYDTESGLRKHAYGGKPKKRYACAMSHWFLWKKCYLDDEPILILEHDALFIEKLKPKYILNSKYNVVGLNNPKNATRMAGIFNAIVQKGNRDIIPCPIVDKMEIPQGLAGASAYIMKPKGAKDVLKAVEKYGLWPNDAILCQQLVPKMGVTGKYYTTIQGLPSTTFTND